MFKAIEFNPNRIIVGLDITKLCQYKCEYCYARNERYTYSNKDWFVPLDKIMYIIECMLKAPRGFHFEVNVYGGEPSLHPDIDKIIKTLCSIDRIHEVDLITNGRVVHTNDYEKLHPMFSFHASQVKSIDDFIKNALKYKNSIVAVMRTGNEEEQCEECIRKCHENNIFCTIGFAQTDQKFVLQKRFDIENEVRYICDERGLTLHDIFFEDWFHKSFKGKTCLMNDFSIWFNGDIHRCHMEPVNIYTHPDYFRKPHIVQKCMFDNCPNESNLACKKL